MKRILIILSALVLALMLGGCGGTENPSVNDDDYIAQPYIATTLPYESDEPTLALPDDDDYTAQPYTATTQPYENDEPTSALSDDDEYPAEDADMDISDDGSADYAGQPESVETTEGNNASPPVTAPNDSRDRTSANPPSYAPSRDDIADHPANPPGTDTEVSTDQPEVPTATQAESPPADGLSAPEEPFGHHSHDELLEELGSFVSIENRHREMSRDELVTRIVIGLTLSRVGAHESADFAQLFSRYLSWVAETYTEQNIAVYEEMGAPQWLLDHLREAIGTR